MKTRKTNYISALLLISLLASSACQKQESNDGAANNPSLEVAAKGASETIIEDPKAAATQGAAKTKPTKPSEKAAVLPSASIIQSSIIGVWVLSGESCESGNGTIFDTGGKYGSEGDVGTWSIANDKLRIKFIQDEAETSESQIDLKVMQLDANSAILQRGDGSNVEWKRCPQVPNLNATKPIEAK